jgi:hypothetical protein
MPAIRTVPSRRGITTSAVLLLVRGCLRRRIAVIMAGATYRT